MPLGVTRRAPLVQADVADTGAAGDFQDGIHLTSGGCHKLAAVWQVTIDPILR